MQQQITIVWKNTGIRIPQEFFKSIVHRETVRYYIRKKTGILGYRQVFLRNPEDKDDLKLCEFPSLTPGTRIFLRDAFDDKINNNNGNTKSNVDFDPSGDSEIIDSDIESNFEFLDFELETHKKNNEETERNCDNVNHTSGVDVNAELLCEMEKLHMSISKLKKRLKMCGRKSNNDTKINDNPTKLNSNLFSYLFVVIFFVSLNVILICVYFNSMIFDINITETENYENLPGKVETPEDNIILLTTVEEYRTRGIQKHESDGHLDRTNDEMVSSKKFITSEERHLQENDDASSLDESTFVKKISEITQKYAKGLMIAHAFSQLFLFI